MATREACMGAKTFDPPLFRSGVPRNGPRPLPETPLSALDPKTILSFATTCAYLHPMTINQFEGRVRRNSRWAPPGHLNSKGETFFIAGEVAAWLARHPSAARPHPHRVEAHQRAKRPAPTVQMAAASSPAPREGAR